MRLQENRRSLWGWRVAVFSLVGALAFTAALLALVLLGVSDPRPYGTLKTQDQFSDGGQWDTPPELPFQNGILSIAKQSRALIASPYGFHAPGTIRLIARQREGDLLAGYGVWWGEPGASAMVAGVNSEGYFSVFKVEADRDSALIPWRLFPHIKEFGETNQIQVDFAQGQVTIWVNDERAAQFAGESPGRLAVGVYAEAPETGGAIFQFEELSIWEEVAETP